MSHTSRTADIENLVDELVALNLSQAANLREFAQALAAGEGTIQLGRALRHREARGSNFTGNSNRSLSRHLRSRGIAERVPARSSCRENVGLRTATGFLSLPMLGLPLSLMPQSTHEDAFTKAEMGI
jgi:hypothetical protein